MKRDLIFGWLFLGMALLMVFCIVVKCVNGSWGNLSICTFAFGMNITSAINRFRSYKQRKEWAWQASLARLNESIQSCWSEYDEENKITE